MGRNAKKGREVIKREKWKCCERQKIYRKLKRDLKKSSKNLIFKRNIKNILKKYIN